MQEKAGLYFHIPFCKNKCPYCDFYSNKYNCSDAKNYTEKIIYQIKKHNGAFDTVYFGGGTPSIVEPEFIEQILKAAENQFDIDKSSEITIECNPSKDLSENFKLYKKMGINRVSIGMQSAVDKERFALGRIADKNAVKKAVDDAKNAGIDNISLDLMLGIPNQTLSSLDETFDFIDKMNIQHISAYMLKIEENTKFYQIQNNLNLPDDDITAQMYLKTIEVLNTFGLKQYEISNFAKEDYQSKHNIKYWKLVDYLGIGISAHSFINNKRFYYDKDFNIIEDGVGGDTSEKIMLGLRLCQGIDKNLLTKPYQQYIKANLMVEKQSKVCLTPQGMLVSNTIISELI